MKFSVLRIVCDLIVTFTYNSWGRHQSLSLYLQYFSPSIHLVVYVHILYCQIRVKRYYTLFISIAIFSFSISCHLHKSPCVSYYYRLSPFSQHCVPSPLYYSVYFIYLYHIIIFDVSPSNKSTFPWFKQKLLLNR